MACEMAATGTPDRDMARALNETGYRTTGNRGSNPFTTDTGRPMLQNRFDLGELPDGEGGWILGKHAAMIDVAIFDAAINARFRNIRRRHNPGTPLRSPWALSGGASCGCGSAMRSSGRSDHRRRIECSARSQGLTCDAPSFFADVVEDQLADLLSHVRIPDDRRDALVAHWEERAQNRRSPAQERERLARKAERVKALYIEGELDDRAHSRRHRHTNHGGQPRRRCGRIPG